MYPILAEINKYSNITSKTEMEPLLATFIKNIENGLIKTDMCYQKHTKIIGTMIQIIKYVEETFMNKNIEQIYVSLLKSILFRYLNPLLKKLNIKRFTMI